MTNVQNFAGKTVMVFVAAAMIFTMFAPAVRAQSNVEGLQTQINLLLAQIAALQAQSGTGAQTAVGTSSVCPFSWTRNLNNGATGADVMKLQQFLNSNADTRVAASGAGSVGMETSSYGPATAAAVSKMQVMYRAEILTPGGLVNPTGFFGPSSRAKANALCVTAPAVVVPGTGTGTSTATTTRPGTPADLSGEADLDSFELNDASDSTIEEGDTDAEIAVIAFEFSQGDAEVNRLDISLERTGTTGEQDPWDTFETISLWVDGDMIAEADASSRDDYTSERDGTLRFSNLDLVAMEDEEMEIVVAATVQNTVRNLVPPGTWNVTVDSMRYFDADGVATTESGDLVTGETASFSIEVAGQGEEVRISLASSNPRSTDIIVDDSRTTNDVTIMAMDLEARDGDIEFTTLVVRVETPSTDTDDVINDIELVIDGQTFRDADFATSGLAPAALSGGLSWNDTTGNFAWYLFDIDRDLMIEEDDEVEVEVVVDFKSRITANYPNGQRVIASVATAEKSFWVAEGANDIVAANFEGSAIGEEHKLLSEGAAVRKVADNATENYNATTPDSTTGTFTLDLELTAVEQTMFVPLTAARGASPTTGIAYQMEDGSNGIIIPGVATQALTRVSGGRIVGNFLEISSGQTATVRLSVSYNPATGGFHRVQGLTVGFHPEAIVNAIQTTVLVPEEDFETAVVNIRS